MKSVQMTPWAIFVALVAVEIAFLVRLLSLSSVSVPLLTAIGVIAILLVLLLRVGDLTRLNVGKGWLEAEVTRIQQDVDKKVNQVGSEIRGNVEDVRHRQEETERKQNELQEIIRALSIALEGIITKYEMVHLEKLRPSVDDAVRYGPNFFAEIERLDAIGFITPIKKDGIIAVKNEHGNSGELLNLREYVQLTGKGINYLEIVSRFKNGAGLTI